MSPSSHGNSYPRDWVVLTRAAHCPYCKLALKALDALGYTPTVHVVQPDTQLRDVMLTLGMSSVPQVWHNGEHIGGWQSLRAYLNLEPGWGESEDI